MKIKKLMADIIADKLDAVERDDKFAWAAQEYGDAVYVVSRFMGFVVPRRVWFIGSVFEGSGGNEKMVDTFRDNDVATLKLTEGAWYRTAYPKDKLRKLLTESGNPVYVDERLLSRYWNPERCTYSQHTGNVLKPIQVYEGNWELVGVICPIAIRGDVVNERG